RPLFRAIRNDSPSSESSFAPDWWLKALKQVFSQVCDSHSLLIPCIAIANCDRLVFERLMVDSNAEWCADLVLSRVKFTDAARIVVNGAQHGLQAALD